MRKRVPVRCVSRVLGLGVVTAVVNGCFFVALSDRAECDDALEIVCACSSRPCDRDPVPRIVKRLRSCGSDDVRPSYYNIHICINEAGDAYCDVLDGLLDDDGALCDIECTNDNACDQETSCHEYQYDHCDLALVDGVVDAGS